MSRTPATTPPEAAPTRKDWLGLAVLSLGLGLIVLDGTIVGVALPAIISDIGLDVADAQWVNSLYAVLLAALLLSTGKLADRWGRRRMFLIGLIVFVGGSLLAAVSGAAAPLIGHCGHEVRTCPCWSGGESHR
ncbi:MFS transporter [Saccharopolyspora shandongensis]|uniref:MFS transporter n=1 Tax=Saccharopolyspora shandongensis TaxID=418495 RepID=UPI003424FAA1